MTNETSEVITEDVDQVVEEAAAPVQETDPVAALTADLQRLQAEYANYRKRVERDRAVAHELAIGSVLTELLATLDDIDRASEHNELTGGFKAVADQLTAITTRIGLEKYGTAGDAFDPQIHEALLHDTSSDVAISTASKILQPGYKFKERILRPARVAVTEPQTQEEVSAEG
jgi:molecular chaperone GrpE